MTIHLPSVARVDFLPVAVHCRIRVRAKSNGRATHSARSGEIGGTGRKLNDREFRRPAEHARE